MPSEHHAARTSTVPITVDGRAHQVSAGRTLAALVADLGHAPQEVGTAVNGRFVARESRAVHALQPGDAVLLFQPIVGG